MRVRGLRGGSTRQLPVAAALCAAACLPTACSNGIDDETVAAIRVVRDGSAKATLQKYFDTHPQCAPVLFHDDEARVLQAAPGNKGAAALLAAGLIVQVRPEQTSTWRTYRPAPAARRWFREDPSNVDAPVLCFARRRVKEVSLVPTVGGLQFGYTFDLIDPSPWMLRPDMQAAFPAVIRSFNTIFAGRENITTDVGVPETILPFADYRDTPFLNYDVNFSGVGLLPPSRPKTFDWRPSS